MITPQTRVFSLNFCAVTLGTLPAFSGFADGDGITMGYANDDFEQVTGSDGFTIWVQKHNVVVDVSIRLAMGNPLTALVRQLHKASALAGGILYPFSAINLKSTDERVAGQAMIKKQPEIKWADSAQPIEIALGVSASEFAGGTIVPG
jgi:hypothetical protein